MCHRIAAKPIRSASAHPIGTKTQMPVTPICGISRKDIKNAPPHAILRTFSVLHGDCDTASHTQSQQDRSQKDHQCIRRSDCCQRIRSQNATCHPCVGVLYLCCSRLPNMSGREILCFCRNESTCKILRKYPYFVNSVITSLITLPSALPFRCGITVFMICPLFFVASTSANCSVTIF